MITITFKYYAKEDDFETTNKTVTIPLTQWNSVIGNKYDKAADVWFNLDIIGEIDSFVIVNES